MTSDPAGLTVSSARRATAVAVLVALGVLVAGWTIRPATPELDPAETGDLSLRALVDARHDGAGHRLAVAVVDLGDAGTPVRFAGYGAGQHSVFEIGSVTKGLTGLLLAEAVDRGEVRLDQPVGELLPLQGSDAAALTFEELATHHSGLPRLSMRPTVLARSLLASLRAANPYPYDVDDLLAHARAAGTGGRGTPAYSNLGAALLGQALARAAGTTYPQLLADRIFTPLRMAESRSPVGAAGAAPPGYTAGGREQAPWVQDGYAPAGGVVSTAGDLALLAKALLGGTGVEALSPRRDFGDGERIGLHWITSPLPGTDRSMIWHNGGTGGYRSFFGLDPEKRRAVVVLSDVTVDVDELATELLAEES